MRGDYTEPLMFGLKSAQATSLVFAIIAAALFVWAGYSQKKETVKAKPGRPNKKS